MKLSYLVFDRYIPIGGGKREFRADQGYVLDRLADENAVRIQTPEGKVVIADQTGASWIPEEPDGGDQPSPPGGPTGRRARKRQG